MPRTTAWLKPVVGYFGLKKFWGKVNLGKLIAERSKLNEAALIAWFLY